jgi:hypothetical protein
MTIMAAEAVPAMAGAGASTGVSAAGTGMATRTTASRTIAGRSTAGTRGKATGRTAQPRASQGRTVPVRARAERLPARAGAEAWDRPATLPPKTYHRWILAEYAVCIVVVASHPFLAPKKDVETSAVTKSLAMPVIRLTALSMVFFVLALLANGPRTGKVAAAFGGLVTLGVIMNATESAKTLSKMFTPKKEET